MKNKSLSKVLILSVFIFTLASHSYASPLTDLRLFKFDRSCSGLEKDQLVKCLDQLFAAQLNRANRSDALALRAYKAATSGKAPLNLVLQEQAPSVKVSVDDHVLGQHLGFRGLVSVDLSASGTDLDFLIFFHSESVPAPLNLRETVFHELLSHFTHYYQVYEEMNRDQTKVMAYLQDHQKSQDVWKLTHFGAALVELQFHRMVPKAMLLAEVDELLKHPNSVVPWTAWRNHYERIYGLSPREFVKVRMQAEYCMQGKANCLTDAEFEPLFNRAIELGFDLKTPLGPAKK